MTAKPRYSAQIPGHTQPGFGIRVPPGDGPLVARVHTGTTLDAVFYLEMHLPLLIHRVALCRAHVRRAFVRTDAVADGRIDFDVRFRVAPPLIAVGNEAKAFGDA